MLKESRRTRETGIGNKIKHTPGIACSVAAAATVEANSYFFNAGLVPLAFFFVSLGFCSAFFGAGLGASFEDLAGALGAASTTFAGALA